MHNYLIDVFILQVELRSSLYSIFITDWMSVFPKEHLYFIKLEEYAADRQKELSKIYSFLNIGESHCTIYRQIEKLLRSVIWNGLLNLLKS